MLNCRRRNCVAQGGRERMKHEGRQRAEPDAPYLQRRHPACGFRRLPAAGFRKRVKWAQPVSWTPVPQTAALISSALACNRKQEPRSRGSFYIRFSNEASSSCQFRQFWTARRCPHCQSGDISRHSQPSSATVIIAYRPFLGSKIPIKSLLREWALGLCWRVIGRGHFVSGTCLLNFLRYCFHHGFNQS